MFFCNNLGILGKGVKLFIIKLSSYVYDHADHYNQNQLMDITRLSKFLSDILNFTGITM